MTAHSHTFHEMIVPIDGCIQVETAGQKLEGRRGEVLLYRAGVSHAEKSDPRDPVATRFIAFSCPSDLSGLPLEVKDAGGRILQAMEWLAEDRDLAPARRPSNSGTGCWSLSSPSIASAPVPSRRITCS